MNIILDNCVPAALSDDLRDFQVSHVAQRGWQTLTNGVLLQTCADAGMRVLLTTDRGIQHQQNLTKLPLHVIVLISQANTLALLRLVIPTTKDAIDSLVTAPPSPSQFILATRERWLRVHPA